MHVLLARVADLEVVPGETVGPETILGPGMDHHCRVGTFERAGSSMDLPPAALFRGRPQDLDRQADVVCDTCEAMPVPTATAAIRL